MQEISIFAEIMDYEVSRKAVLYAFSPFLHLGIGGGQPKPILLTKNKK